MCIEDREFEYDVVQIGEDHKYDHDIQSTTVFFHLLSRHMATPTMRLVPGAGVMWSEMLRGVGRFVLLDILIDFDRF